MKNKIIENLKFFGFMLLVSPILFLMFIFKLLLGLVYLVFTFPLWLFWGWEL